MATWIPTAADRDKAGTIKTQFATILDESLAATGAALASDDQEQPAARPTPPSWLPIASAIAALVLVGVLVALLQQTPAAPPAQPTTAPSPAATLMAPTAVLFGYPLDVALVAYFDPADPASAVALENGRHVLPVARLGQAWLQLELEDGAQVWVRWEDLPAPSALLDDLPDRTPPTTIPASAPEPAVGAAALIVESVPAPQTCIRTDYGLRCGPASSMADEEQVIAEIATESKERSDAWLATATAEARP